MSIRKDLKEIKETLKEKSKQYDEMKECLKSIKLKVKNAKVVFLENGTYGLEVSYDIAPVVVQYDRTTQEWAKNNTFYAINKLDLISFKDVTQINKILNEVIKKNNIEGGKK